VQPLHRNALAPVLFPSGGVDRNAVGDISRKKEPRGRARFLSEEERTALLDACARSEWPALRTLVLLAITTDYRHYR